MRKGLLVSTAALLPWFASGSQHFWNSVRTGSAPSQGLLIPPSARPVFLFCAAQHCECPLRSQVSTGDNNRVHKGHWTNVGSGEGRTACGGEKIVIAMQGDRCCIAVSYPKRGYASPTRSLDRLDCLAKAPAKTDRNHQILLGQ